jgi:hypothetical protein
MAAAGLDLPHVGITPLILASIQETHADLRLLCKPLVLEMRQLGRYQTPPQTNSTPGCSANSVVDKPLSPMLQIT